MVKSKSLSIILYILFFSSCLLPCFLFAQNPQKGEFVADQQIDMLTDSEISTKGMEVKNSIVSKNQISLEAGGILIYNLAYARRFKNTNWSVGGGVGFGWELNWNSLERNIWNAINVTGFVRYQYSKMLQVETGPTLLGYTWTDDCSECNGTFVGLQSAAMIGYKFVFLGPGLWTGWANDDKYGSEFGAIWILQLRLVIPWG